VPISKRGIKQLSAGIRKIIDGRDVDLRDNREGVFSVLKNDIHTLANMKNEQVDALRRDRDMLKDTLADISHQLKTPLTSMMIMAELLENALAADGPPLEKHMEFVTNIKTGLARTEWLVSALLKMAKLDAGAVDFSREPMLSDALIGLALEPLRILLEVKNQSAEIAGETELLCDKRWTAEALTNILKNASEYSPDGAVIRIGSGTNPICAWISVTDGGTGFTSAEAANLFKRFTGSRSDKGYGIGLPLALAIMRGQNGDIQVDGGGKGTGATVTLKLYK
jgi:signal transduction histidine kinase